MRNRAKLAPAAYHIADASKKLTLVTCAQKNRRKSTTRLHLLLTSHLIAHLLKISIILYSNRLTKFHPNVCLRTTWEHATKARNPNYFWQILNNFFSFDLSHLLRSKMISYRLLEYFFLLILRLVLMEGLVFSNFYNSYTMAQKIPHLFFCSSFYPRVSAACKDPTWNTRRFPNKTKRMEFAICQLSFTFLFDNKPS